MISVTDAETRSCQSCQTQFTIEPEDFAFYAKIDVPPPTWCPSCRAQRRMAWRNEWHLFRKLDAVSGQEIFSSFSPSSPVKVTDKAYWLSDAWDPLQFGRDYDFSRPFFEQIKALLYEVPLPARAILELENSDYSFNCGYLKNCYLVCAATGTEDSAYVVWDSQSRNMFDTHMTHGCELCYGSLNLSNCYQTHFCQNCDGCRGVYLSKDLIGCQDCFGCVNLRNKQYYIWNEPHSKEEYERKLTEFALGSQTNLEQLRQRVEQFWLRYPNKFTIGTNNESATGEYVYNSKNVTSGFRVWKSQDSKYCQNILNGPHKDCYDQTNYGEGAEFVYESMQCGAQVYNLKFCVSTFSNNQDLQYSIFCQSAKNLFGCVSVRNKQYCVLNKQYTKEEYETLVPRIIEHMNDLPYVDSKGREYRYGEFFPHELSPLEYNLTIAQEEFPLSKDEAVAQGYRWYDRPKQERSVELELQDLPDEITNATQKLVGKVIRCQHHGECAEECTGVFTIIAQELVFLLEQGLPLPRLCPHCRHYSRILKRRPMTLHTRQCQCAGQRSSNGVYANTTTNHPDHAPDAPCPNRFKTSFAPDRPEIVYCESCYQQEVV